MKNSKVLRMVCTALILILLLAVLCLMFGNPVSYVLVSMRTEAHLENHYPGTDLRIESVRYDFKHPGYTVHVVSPSSTDTHFRLLCSGFGDVTTDYYESAVASGSNTLARLSGAYDSHTKEVLGDFPFDADLCRGELTEKYGNESGSLHKEFGLDKSTLVLDADYDIPSLARDHGRIHICIYDEDVSVENAADILLDLKNHADQRDLPFHAIDFTLLPPRNPDSTNSTTEGIYLFDFLYADIYEDGLTDRVASANEEAQSYLDLDP